jgi:hypothetical protein
MQSRSIGALRESSGGRSHMAFRLTFMFYTMYEALYRLVAPLKPCVCAPSHLGIKCLGFTNLITDAVTLAFLSFSAQQGHLDFQKSVFKPVDAFSSVDSFYSLFHWYKGLQRGG